MEQRIFNYIFAMGLLLVLCVSAGTAATIMIMKPETPKQVTTFFGEAHKGKAWVTEKADMGFITKTASYSADNNGDDRVFIVMERYQ